MPMRERNHIYRRGFEDENKRVSAPSHRHAAPSAPWPWIDITDGVNQGQLESVLPPVPEPCSHMPASCNNCWREYPQSLYPNWTPEQVRKSKIDKAIKQYRRDVRCVIHQVDVDENGLFAVPEDGRIESDDSLLEDTWIRIVNNKAPIANRVRALFIENMSGPVLQMLGAKYNIEPFFFSSSLNWIPSRYQEQVMPGDGDHITLCLIFLRSVPDGSATSMSAVSPYPAAQVEGNVRGNGNVNGAASTPFHGSPSTSTFREDYELSLLADQMIDTQAPLVLKSNRRLLVLDLLSVHLIRRAQGSVIISYHADKDLPTTTAPYLHERIQFAGQSVYWQKIFQTSPDPTFVLLTFMWHALYSWDEALENLYTHICSLESHVITTSEMTLTQELHAIRAHHLHYASLLNDFRKTVTFIRNTENPALERLSDEERKANASLLSRECENLLTEIARLEKARKMQDSRLKNVMNLVFSSVNIIDSRRMQKMTEAAAKDSAAMKQIAYLTMVFLPASFVAAVFGMNVKEISPDTNGTLAHYAETAIPFTLVTIWIIVAVQSKYIFGSDVSLWKRLGWPVLLPLKMFRPDKAEVQEGGSHGLDQDGKYNMHVYGVGGHHGAACASATGVTIAEALESMQRL